MDTDQKLAQLKARIDALPTDVASKQEIATALSELHVSVKSIEDKLALSDRLSKVEREHESWKTLATYIAITVSILGVVLGYLGFTSVDKFLREQVDKRFAYSEDLGYGLSLADKHATFAIPHLLRCFQERPFDEPLVITLLSAADNADDWDTMRTVMQELRKHPIKVNSFSDALTYNNIGIAELNLGFEEPSHFTRSREAFERGIQIASGNKPQVLWYLHTNLWRYYLATNDTQHAKREVEIAKRFDPPPEVDSWAKAAQWAWFKAFFATEHKIDRQQIEQMYKEVSRTKD
jgi:hypothetical protein